MSFAFFFYSPTSFELEFIVVSFWILMNCVVSFETLNEKKNSSKGVKQTSWVQIETTLAWMNDAHILLIDSIVCLCAMPQWRQLKYENIHLYPHNANLRALFVFIFISNELMYLTEISWAGKQCQPTDIHTRT